MNSCDYYTRWLSDNGRELQQEWVNQGQVEPYQTFVNNLWEKCKRGYIRRHTPEWKRPEYQAQR